MNRRSFLKGSLLAGVAAKAAMPRNILAAEAPVNTMLGFRAPALPKIRIGYIGLGNRGPVHFYTMVKAIPWTEMRALCDIRKSQVDWRCDWVAKQKNQNFRPDGYSGSEDIWKKVCERDDIDMIYICTPWLLHAEMAIYAMKCGKHVAIEVPAAVTIEECWELVKTSEATRKHCIMLENCCYGENEMFMNSLCHHGVLGDVVHGECGYIHDLVFSKLNEGKGGYYKRWRLDYTRKHDGNAYPTHGLGPIAWMMDINHGDQFRVLTSLSSDVFRMPQYASKMFSKGRPEREKSYYKQGDVNTALIKTHRGRTIMVQHDTTLPQPYSRINSIRGTLGTVMDFPFRMALCPKSHGWMKDEDINKLKEKYMPELWKQKGEYAKKNGGHGGMDYLMNYDILTRLRDGAPMLMDCYDAASWSCLMELTEKSTLADGAPIQVPDFTRGHWKTQKSLFQEG